MSILENGINETYAKSSVYAEEYMKEKSEYEKSNPDEAYDSFISIKKRFEDFNKVMESIGKRVNYPFSKEIYGIASRSYKFQISIAMILAAIMHKIINNGVSL